MPGSIKLKPFPFKNKDVEKGDWIMEVGRNSPGKVKEKFWAGRVPMFRLENGRLVPDNLASPIPKRPTAAAARSMAVRSYQRGYRDGMKAIDPFMYTHRAYDRIMSLAHSPNNADLQAQKKIAIDAIQFIREWVDLYKDELYNNGKFHNILDYFANLREDFAYINQFVTLIGTRPFSPQHAADGIVDLVPQFQKVFNLENKVKNLWRVWMFRGTE